MFRVAFLLATSAVPLALFAVIRRRLALGKYTPAQIPGQRFGQVVMVAVASATVGGAFDTAIRWLWSGVPAAVAICLGIVAGVALAVGVGLREYLAVVGGERWDAPLQRIWRTVDMTSTSRALVAAIANCSALVLWVAAPNGDKPRVPAFVLAPLMTALGVLATRHWWRSRHRGVSGT